MKESKKYIFLYLLFAIIFSLSLLFLMFLSARLISPTYSTTNNADTSMTENAPTVVIDAGHGGEDGGAVGKSGVYEKALNLLIANDLRDMLEINGINVIMTRDSDTMLYDKNSDYKGRKKMLDMAERLRIAKSSENVIFVSIHMNSFPEEKYSGLQVYYSSNNESSKRLAERIQATVCEVLQKNNTRTVKSAGSSIYLLDRITSPAVLVECGFISNSEECTLLCTKEYRQKLTVSIFCGIMDFISTDAT